LREKPTLLISLSMSSSRVTASAWVVAQALLLAPHAVQAQSLPAAQAACDAIAGDCVGIAPGGTAAAALGGEHPDVATSLVDLADLLDELGRTSEAMPLYARALALREAALGRDDLDVADLLERWARAQDRQGSGNVAEAFDRRALTIRERALGPGHPAVATTLRNLGIVVAGQARFRDAEPLLRRALAIREAAFGREHRRARSISRQPATSELALPVRLIS